MIKKIAVALLFTAIFENRDQIIGDLWEPNWTGGILRKSHNILGAFRTTWTLPLIGLVLSILPKVLLFSIYP